ncbi:hypothetical protein BH11BAC4_BH11BAC4_24640 [soil metagenome]
MISLNYSISKEDYINYYTYVLWDAPANRKKRISYYLRQLVPLLLFIFAFYYTGIFDRSSKFTLIIIAAIILTSIFSFIGVRSNTLRRAEKIASDPSNSSIFLETAMIVSETGIALKNRLAETRYQWNAFIKKQESNEYYFLFTSGIQAMIIPKRIFNQDERMQFEKLLSQQLSFDAEIGHLIKS